MSGGGPRVAPDVLSRGGPSRAAFGCGGATSCRPEAAAMFLFYFNKLGLGGSILLSIVLTVVAILAFRLLNG